MSIEGWQKDSALIEKRWLLQTHEQIAVHPNHDYRLRRDIARLIDIIREQQHYILEQFGKQQLVQQPTGTAMVNPSINRFDVGKIKCTCGRFFRDTYCPVHRVQEMKNHKREAVADE